MASKKAVRPSEKAKIIEKYAESIFYSPRYSDSTHEYRHVILPKPLAALLSSTDGLISEVEWRGLGIRQSLGWENHMRHAPEPHILIFRRDL